MRVERATVGTGLGEVVGSGEYAPGWYQVPPSRPSTFPRDRLLKRLSEAQTPIVAVTAPAGYGKTTQLVSWAEVDARPFAWVQLTAADNDPVHLARHVALALDLVQAVAGEDGARLVGAGRSSVLDLFPTVARLMECRAPLVLVLDDLHLVTSAASLRGVDALLARVPPGCCVALAGRSLPVRLGRMRVGGGVVDLTAGDLAMDPFEASELLARAGLSLEDHDVDDLVELTEGWPAGLQLAALAISQGQPLASFSGGHHLVGEYLVEEVLASTSSDVVGFLEQSATVEPMTAAILDALLDRSDSGHVLASIEASGNLFLVPLDGDGLSYRYHHLLRDHLRRRLRRDDPQLASRLDSRASVLLERAGDPDSAIRHAVDAGELERAADLILRSTLRRWVDGRHRQLGEWLTMSGEAVHRYPSAVIATAWFSVAVGDHDRAVRACAAAERLEDSGPLADGSPSLSVALAAIRIVVGADGVGGVVRDAEIVRDAGGPARNPWWAFATGFQGSAYSMLGELDLARRRLEECLAADDGAPFLQAAGHAHLGLLALYDGDLAEARRLASEGRRIADANHFETFLPGVAVYAISGLVAARCHRPAEARHSSAIARRSLTRLGRLSPRTSVLGHLLLAQTAVSLGDRPGARSLLREAQLARRRDPSAVHLNAQIDDLARDLGSAGDLRGADLRQLTTAELRVLEYLPTHLSLQEIARDLLLSRNTVKSHTVAIYRKLGASSRGGAVTSARRLGLLDPG